MKTSIFLGSNSLFSYSRLKLQGCKLLSERKIKQRTPFSYENDQKKVWARQICFIVLISRFKACCTLVTSLKQQNDVTAFNAITDVTFDHFSVVNDVQAARAFRTVTLLFHITRFFNSGFISVVCANNTLLIRSKNKKA